MGRWDPNTPLGTLVLTSSANQFVDSIAISIVDSIASSIVDSFAEPRN